MRGCDSSTCCRYWHSIGEAYRDGRYVEAVVTTANEIRANGMPRCRVAIVLMRQMVSDGRLSKTGRLRR